MQILLLNEKKRTKIKCNSWRLNKEENKNIVYKHPSYNTDTYHHAAFSLCKLNDPPPYLAGERKESSHFFYVVSAWKWKGNANFPCIT